MAELLVFSKDRDQLAGKHVKKTRFFIVQAYHWEVI